MITSSCITLCLQVYNELRNRFTTLYEMSINSVLEKVALVDSRQRKLRLLHVRAA